MLPEVESPVVWRGIRVLYVGSALLFLATLALGVANIVNAPDIGEGQILAHLHSGTIGWITLSVIATTFWLFLGGRPVTARDRNFVFLVSGLAPIVVAGYVAAFGLYFSGNAPAWMLPAFGVPAGLVIIAATAYAGMQVKHQPTLTTAHLLLLGALIVASLGATMGILVGLSFGGNFDFPDAGDGIGSHAGPMDMYLALAFAGFIELLFVKEAGRWTWPGMTQAGLGVVAAFIVSLGLFYGIEPAAPLGLLLFLAAFAVYMARVGWKALTGSLGPQHPGLWWGSIGFPAYVLLFVYIVFTYFIPGEEPPHGLIVTFVHVTFVAMATNLVFAMQSGFDGIPTAWERRGIWIMNLGLLAFIAGEVFGGRADGAWLMALGVLIAWIQIPGRILRGGFDPGTGAAPLQSSGDEE